MMMDGKEHKLKLTKQKKTKNETYYYIMHTV